MSGDTEHPAQWITGHWEHIAVGLTDGDDLADVSRRVNLIAARHGSRGLYVLGRAAAELVSFLLGAGQALERVRRERPGAFLFPEVDDERARQAFGLPGADARALLDARRFVVAHINGDDDTMLGLFKAWDGKAMSLTAGVLSLVRLAFRERGRGVPDVG